MKVSENRVDTFPNNFHIVDLTTKLLELLQAAEAAKHNSQVSSSVGFETETRPKSIRCNNYQSCMRHSHIHYGLTKKKKFLFIMLTLIVLFVCFRVFVTKANHPAKTPKTQKRLPMLKLKCNTGILWPFGIAIINTSDMIITDYRLNGSLHIYNRVGTFQYKTRSYSLPFNILPLPEGKLLVTDQANIHVLAVSTFKTVQKLPMVLCWGLALNRNRSIIAAACIGSKAERSRGYVVLLKPDGTIIKKIDRFNGQKLFKVPRFCAFTSKDHLLVTDESDTKNPLTVLSPEGVPLYTYGSKGSGEGQLRIPTGVCVDRYDNIIIADSDNHRIHLLNRDGKFVKYVVTKRDGLRYPLAVAINNEGDLVVTQLKGEVKVFKYVV